MKKQIRYGVFETNSSMTHALTICTEEEYNKWKDGELLYDYYDDEFIKPSEIDEASKDSIDEDEFFTSEGYQNLMERCYYETFSRRFTTPLGDKMIAFGYYGHD